MELIKRGKRYFKTTYNSTPTKECSGGLLWTYFFSVYRRKTPKSHFLEEVGEGRMSF